MAVMPSAMGKGHEPARIRPHMTRDHATSTVGSSGRHFCLEALAACLATLIGVSSGHACDPTTDPDKTDIVQKFACP
jgi:hypothetical protein